MIASRTPLRRQARVIQAFALAADPPTGHRGTITLMGTDIDIDIDIDARRSSSLPEADLSMLWGSSSPCLSHAWNCILQGAGSGFPLFLLALLLPLPWRTGETGRVRGRRERRQCGVSVCVLCGGEWVWRRWGQWQRHDRDVRIDRENIGVEGGRKRGTQRENSLLF